MLSPGTLRLDLKCGKGSISPGEKCTKGLATKKTSNKKIKQATFAEKGLVTLGTAAAVGGLVLARSKRNNPKSIQRERGANAVAIAGGGLGLIGVGLGIYGERTKNQGARDLGAGIALAGGMFASAGRGSAKAEQAHRRRMQEFENMNFESPNWTPPNSEGFNSRYSRSSNRQTSTGTDPNQWSREQQNAYKKRRWQEWANAQRSSNTNQSTRGSNKAVPNPYQSLGIPETASDRDIKKKWLELMRANHPDTGGDPERAKIYNAAYQEILRRRGRRDSIWAKGFEVDWEAIAL